jgi:hypothetical protein
VPRLLSPGRMISPSSSTASFSSRSSSSRGSSSCASADAVSDSVSDCSAASVDAAAEEQDARGAGAAFLAPSDRSIAPEGERLASLLNDIKPYDSPSVRRRRAVAAAALGLSASPAPRAGSTSAPPSPAKPEVTTAEPAAEAASVADAAGPLRSGGRRQAVARWALGVGALLWAVAVGAGAAARFVGRVVSSPVHAARAYRPLGRQLFLLPQGAAPSLDSQAEAVLGGLDAFSAGRAATSAVPPPADDAASLPKARGGLAICPPAHRVPSYRCASLPLCGCPSAAMRVL